MYIHKTGLRLTAAALGALVPAGAVFAADLPVKAAPVVPAYYDWSGVYVGVHAGYGGGMKDWFSDFAADFTARGFLGGGQVGINKQLGSFVFGLELDGSWANIKGSQTFPFGGPVIGFQSTQTTTSKIDGLVTFAGRAGLAADRWFVYAKGGVTLAHESHALNDNGTFPGGPFGLTATPFNDTANGSEHRVAPMVGFGTEYALGNNWSVKAEYDYIHLGSRTPTLKGTDTTAGVTTPLAIDTRIEQAIHVAKVGVNYRFGGLQVDPTFPPVPAAPGYNWSGAYIGAQGAYGFGHKEWSGPDFADPTIPGAGKYDVNGWLAGGTGGVNAQAGVFVFGVEGEWMWTAIKGNQTFTQAFAAISSHTTSLESKIDWLAIASARAGFVVGERLLIYGKAGVAIAEEKHTFNQVLTIVGDGGASTSLNAKAVHTGVVGGVGAEYALGGNWSVKAEYDYIKMLAQSFTGTGPEVINTPGFAPSSIDNERQFGKMSQDLHLFKFGVNYHFSPAPVVVSARY
jgi:outer membrane immunogenic protein